MHYYYWNKLFVNATCAQMHKLNALYNLFTVAMGNELSQSLSNNSCYD